MDGRTAKNQTFILYTPFLLLEVWFLAVLSVLFFSLIFSPIIIIIIIIIFLPELEKNYIYIYIYVHYFGFLSSEKKS